MLNPSFSDNRFPHDLFSLSDTNIQLMIEELGPAGYGIFWAVVEKLYQNGEDGLDGRDIVVLAKQIGSTKEALQHAVGVMVENNLFVRGANGRYYSKRVTQTLTEKAEARGEWYAAKSAAGQASGRSRRAKRNAQNEHLLNTNEHVFNTNEHTVQSSPVQSSTVQSSPVVPQTPVDAGAGPDRPTDDDLPKIPGLKDSQQLTRLQRSDLEKSWGKETVTAYATILADRVRLGQFTVRQNVYTALSGLLRKAKADGEIHEPAPPPRPTPCPSPDKTCPKCGAPLRQTSSDGHEWECHSCGTRFTSDGGGGWIEEEIGVMARMA